MVTVYHYSNNSIRTLTLQEYVKIKPVSEGMFWIDLDNPNEAEEETVLISLFNIHPLAIEDCRRGKDLEHHLPKVEDFGDYLFVIFNPLELKNTQTDHSPSSRKGSLFRYIEFSTKQLSAFLFRGCLITHHYQPLPSVQMAGEACGKNAEVLGRGPDYLFNVIIDNIVDNYSPILDALDEATDALEEEVFRSPTQRTMARILGMKRTIMNVRRIAVYQREMLFRLSRGEFSLITREEMTYYRNVYDHLVRLSDLTDSYRDIIAGLLDAYLSVTSNNLNQVMKVLTIISTIFLPLSVLTGFWGMNFDVLPFSHMRYGAAIAATIMAGVVLVMLWVFKKNRWM